MGESESGFTEKEEKKAQEGFERRKAAEAAAEQLRTFGKQEKKPLIKRGEDLESAA